MPRCGSTLLPRKIVAANVCLPRGDPRALACSPTHDLGNLGILFEFWEISTLLLNLRINKDLELVLSHFLGVKNVRHLPCGFEFSAFNIPESSMRGKQIELRLQQGRVRTRFKVFERFVLMSSLKPGN